MANSIKKHVKKQHEVAPFWLERSLGLGLLLFVLLLSSCATPVLSTPPVEKIESFSLFLQPLPQEANRLSFVINDLTARRVDGSDWPLITESMTFSLAQLLGVQKKIVSSTLPPGRYLGLRLQVVQATLNGEEGEVALLPPAESVYIDYAFAIRSNQAQTLFLSLSADRLVTDGAFFTPTFSLWQPERMLTNLKGFVSNSKSQSLMVFNKKNAQVTGSILIGLGPHDLVLDQKRGWLYVALAGEDSIAVVEVNNDEILGRIRLRFGDEPTELALSASGNTLVSLNRGSKTVSIIDTASLFERGRIRLTTEPSNIFFGKSENRVFVTHAVSSILSVLDLQVPEIRFAAALEQAPLDGIISSDGQSIYLINDFSAELIVLDPESLATRDKIFIGSGAISIRSDSSNRLLFIGKSNGEIAVVDPRALIAIDSFPALGSPVQGLTIDNEENVLFVVLPQSGYLAKIDLVSKQELGRMALGAASYSVVVMGER